MLACDIRHPSLPGASFHGFFVFFLFYNLLYKREKYGAEATTIYTRFRTVKGEAPLLLLTFVFVNQIAYSTGNLVHLYSSSNTLQLCHLVSILGFYMASPVEFKWIFFRRIWRECVYLFRTYH